MKIYTIIKSSQSATYKVGYNGLQSTPIVWIIQIHLVYENGLKSNIKKSLYK